MKPTFFESPAEFRAWLQKHHRTATELWVGYRKKKTGKPSITWQESVDEALCFGWIDGIRKSVDAESYMNRFTPRRPGSFWSAINTRRAAELIKEGRMRAAGRKAFEARDAARTTAHHPCAITRASTARARRHSRRTVPPGSSFRRSHPATDGWRSGGS